ncbi:hypothetical protein MRX96_039829 [Rhipicephalus microplus]
MCNTIIVYSSYILEQNKFVKRSWMIPAAQEICNSKYVNTSGPTVNSFVSRDILTAISQGNSEGNDEGGHGGHHGLAGSGRRTWWTGGLQWPAVALALKRPFALLFTWTSREPFLALNR